MKSKLLFLVLLICLTLAFCISASAMTGSGAAVQYTQLSGVDKDGEASAVFNASYWTSQF